MRVKKYIIYAIFTLLTLIAVYTGITFAATLTKAITQPYLASAVTRFDFLGFYMLACVYGGITLVIIAVIVTAAILIKKRKAKESDR